MATILSTNDDLRRTALRMTGKRLWRVHHYASAGYVDYYRYYKYEYTAKNAFIGKGAIRQIDITWTLERLNTSNQTWEVAAVKDSTGTTWNELGVLVA